MNNFGLNLNTTNVLGLVQMLGGSSSYGTMPNIASIFSLLGNGRSTISGATGSITGSMIAGLALNYAPQILGSFIGGIVSDVREYKAKKDEALNQEDQGQIETNKDMVKRLIEGKIECTEDGPLFNKLVAKYESMKEDIKDETVLTQRLVNFAKGEIYHQKEANWETIIQQVEKDIMNSEDYKKQPDDKKAEFLRNATSQTLKENYPTQFIGFDNKAAQLNSLALQYLEASNTDIDYTKLSLFEVAAEKLTQHYQVKEGLSRDEAAIKAQQYIKPYIKDTNSFINAINNANNAEEESAILKEAFTFVTGLDTNLDLSLDVNEIKRYMLAMSSYTRSENEEADGDIDLSDYYRFNNDLTQGLPRADEFLTAAGATLRLTNTTLESLLQDLNYQTTNENTGTITIAGKTINITNADGKIIVDFGNDNKEEFYSIDELRASLLELKEEFEG